MLSSFNIVTPHHLKNLSICQIYTHFNILKCTAALSLVVGLFVITLKQKKGYAYLFHDHVSQDISFSERIKECFVYINM